MSDYSEQSDSDFGSEDKQLSAVSANGEFPLSVRSLSPRAGGSSTDGTSQNREAPPPAGGMQNYLHAFRRHWFAATALGLLCAAAAGAAAWFTATPSFTSTALIRIAADRDTMIPMPGAAESHTTFDIYKGTQMQLLTSDYVLDAALRKLPSFPILHQQEDPIRWLARSLQTETGENSEVVRVSLTAPDGNQATAIVQAVVDCYIFEVADKERKEHDDKIKDLEGIRSQTSDKMFAQSEKLKGLIADLGSGDSKSLSLLGQIAIQDFNTARSKLDQIQADLDKNGVLLKAKLAAQKIRKNQPAPTIDVDAAAAKDPLINSLQQQRTFVENHIRDVKDVYKPSSGVAKSLIQQDSRKLANIDEQITNRKGQLGEELKGAPSTSNNAADEGINELQLQIADDERREKAAEVDVNAKKKKCDLLGNSSIEVEMQNDDLDELRMVNRVASEQLQKLRVEPESQVRISLFQKASTPLAPDKSSRIQNTVVFGLLGFLAPIGLLLWWDVRGQRVNSARDVIDHLGLSVIGSVPRLPAEVPSGKPLSQRHRKMQISLDHSVDAIAAKMFLQREEGAAHVVLVSSASRGEGKSTLSIQLAKRLARTGSQTLLVDFDLRKPTLHQMIDQPREPGLTEYLRGKSELKKLVRPTGTANLSLLTAGSPFANSLGALSNGVTRSLFAKVRDDFDFIIVDGTPILPVVDALLIGQHVDSVILSVRRDVSQIHRVRAACERLSAFGVEDFAAVLTGTSEEAYDYDDGEILPGNVLEEREPEKAETD